MRIKFLSIALTLLSSTIWADGLHYPHASKGDQVDTYFGHRIADPYRWLENSDAPATRSWIEAENELTQKYLDAIPARAQINARMTRLWNYERYGVPSKEGPWYIFSKNTGLEKQSTIYKTRSLEATPEVLLNPNEWSTDGTVALNDTSFSEDGRYVAYAKAMSGSDWIEWHVKEVATNKDLDDVIRWSKFSEAAWLKDGSGFYYGGYDAPKEGSVLSGINKNQKVYFHKLNTKQTQDTLTYERPDRPDWYFDTQVSDDGRYLFIYQRESTENKNRLFVRDLKDKKGTVKPFLDAFDAHYSVVGNDKDLFYILTNKNAPRYRVVTINLKNTKLEKWGTLIPEGKDQEVLESATMVNNAFVTNWMIDAHSAIRIFDLNGKKVSELQLPTLGAASEMSGKRKQNEGFYSFTSFTFPTTTYRYDFKAKTNTVFRKPNVDFDATKYETTQAFYHSKDGTRIPIFLTYRKGMQKNALNPTLLYGYGGFNIPMLPIFSPATATWLEMGGIYAVANLRGGGEYGQSWYDAGRLKNKQNVFDDFIAAAEYLIGEKYTSTPKLAINGRSNGGLLVGAALTQRPDLFGAAVPGVGVMDMLRYHKFTIGWAWKSDYGDPDTKEGFSINLAYSPLHNIKAKTKYPPTFITTGDHDDRVVPGHSFKFAATLQAAQAASAPILIRIDTKAGHGSGKSTQKQIEEYSDGYAFLAHELKMTLPGDF